MKTLTTALIAELNLTVTRPGYLIELGYSPTLRMSTLSDLSWNGQTWIGWDAKVSGVSLDGKGVNKATLTLGNTDTTISAVVLGVGAADIPVSIWAIYAGATALGDAVQVFSGVMDGCTIDADKVRFTLSPQGTQTLESPRVFISNLTGFNWLKPAGSVVTVGTDNFALKSYSAARG